MAVPYLVQTQIGKIMSAAGQQRELFFFSFVFFWVFPFFEVKVQCLWSDGFVLTRKLHVAIKIDLFLNTFMKLFKYTQPNFFSRGRMDQRPNF